MSIRRAAITTDVDMVRMCIHKDYCILLITWQAGMRVADRQAEVPHVCQG